MKQLMEYMVRHHDDLLKTLTDEQKEIFEKFDDCWSENKISPMRVRCQYTLRTEKTEWTL